MRTRVSNKRFYLIIAAIISVTIPIIIWSIVCSKKHLVRERFIETQQEEIPKLIWTYWHDNDIPEVVIGLMDTWRKHNPGYSITMVTKNTMEKHLPDVDMSTFRHVENNAHFSDRIRIKLLQKYGGFWMDASILCTESLDWIRRIQANQQGCELVIYYLNGFTTDNRFPVVENWFIACVPQANMINLWDAEMSYMDGFASRRAYIDYVKSIGVNLQHINEDLYEYLSMHVAAQVIFQKQMKEESIKKQIHFMKAEDGPLKYISENNWDTDVALKGLCERWGDYKHGIIKFRSAERQKLESSLRGCFDKLVSFNN